MSHPSSRRHLLTVACTLGGLVLFAYVVRRTGVADILDGVQRVGWGLAAVLALAGLRFAVRAACWRMCMPPGTSLSLGQALSAFLAGDDGPDIEAINFVMRQLRADEPGDGREKINRHQHFVVGAAGRSARFSPAMPWGA